MKVINFNAQASSMQKGETFYDTVKTFESFGLDAVVIRDRQDEYYKQLQGPDQHSDPQCRRRQENHRPSRCSI